MTVTRTIERTATRTWTIDPDHSMVEFSAKHLMITTVKGRFGAVAGTIVTDVDDPTKSSVNVTVGAGSIDTRTEQRDQHLRSPDFLDAERFPAITFVSRRVEGRAERPGDEFRVIGDLTIRGTTREVVLAASFEGEGRDPWGGTRASYSATTRIDRRDFGLTWNQALEAGGVLVGNEVKISLEVQATAA